MTTATLQQLAQRYWSIPLFDSSTEQGESNVSNVLLDACNVATQYITYAQFKNTLMALGKKLCKKYAKFSILLNSKHSLNLSPDHWVLCLLWPIIHKHCVHVLHKLPDELDHPVVVLADRTYSANLIQCIIDLNTYSAKKMGYRQDINFIIALPYIGVRALYNLQKNTLLPITDVLYEQIISCPFHDGDENSTILAAKDDHQKVLMSIYYNNDLLAARESFQRICATHVSTEISREKVEELAALV